MMRSGLHIIFDTAAALIGQAHVSDPLQDTGRLASSLRAHWEGVAEEVCQEFDWSSCRTRARMMAETLAVGEVLPPPFTLRFPLPADYLRLCDMDSQISGFHGTHSVEIDPLTNWRVMLADFNPEWIIYSRFPGADNLDPLLRTAIAARLAQRVARIVTESDGRAREVEAQAQQAFDRAVASSVFERSADIDVPVSWSSRMHGAG
jgi:hypothetical protein